MTLDLDHLSKLAEAAKDTPGDEWFDEENFMFVMPAADRKYIAALDPATVQELIRLARLGMEKEPMLTTDDIPPERRGSIFLECSPPMIVKDSEVDHCERVHGR